jgi:glucose/arabinose dehydrogenase
MICQMIYRARVRRWLALLALIFCAGSGTGSAETFNDAGFSSELITSLPPYTTVGLAWAPDGRMFIWQKNGVIRIFKNGTLLPTPFLNYNIIVNSTDDRGMWGIAFDPGYSTNRYLYMTYVYEPDGNPNDPGPKTSRLVRVTADPNHPDVMLPGSEVVLLDNAPVSYGTHSMGGIRFAADGTLFVGNGDGSSFTLADTNALEAQNLDSLRGKILHLNRDGSAATNNPFYDGSDSVHSRVWAYGLRNPYRISLNPLTGQPYAGDLGWYTRESLQRIVPGGNYGWPCYEAGLSNHDYQVTFQMCTNPTPIVPPVLNYDHLSGDINEGGTCIIGGDFYVGNRYPPAYRTNYFYCDFSSHWMHRAVLNANGDVIDKQRFASDMGGISCMERGPDGFLYYVVFTTGEIRRIIYDNLLAIASASVTSGYSPLSVSFSSDGSTNFNGEPLSYFWDFGDGSSSTNANPTHLYITNAVTTYTVTLIASNDVQSGSTNLQITVGSLPPLPAISAPTNGAGFMPGQVVNFQGSASDPDDGAVPPSALSWTLLFSHDGQTDTNPAGTGASGSFTIQYSSTNPPPSYQLVLTAVDSSGLIASTNIAIPVLPDTVNPSVPANLNATPGSSEIFLMWDPASDNAAVADYIIERAGGPTTNFLQIATTANTDFTDTALIGNTAYTYRIRARDASGNVSGYSNSAGALSPGTSAGLGLVAAYAFSEGSGTAVVDASGNGNYGMINGATWTNSAKYGSGLVFDGVSARVTIPDAPELRLTNGMTLEAWIYPRFNNNNWDDVLYKGVDNYYLESATAAAGVPAVGGTFASNLFGLSRLPTNTWTHLAGTYDGLFLRLYINGTEVSNTPLTGPISTSSNPLQIGGDDIFGQFFNGIIDEVRVYNRALSADEIQADMNSPIIPPQITLTSPSDNSVFHQDSGTIQLSATATDSNGFVARVEMFSSGNPNPLATFTNAPYTFTFAGLAPGAYTFSARATDNSGLVTWASPVAITIVSNTSLPYGLTNRPLMTPYLNMPHTGDQPLPARLSQTGTFLDVTNLLTAPSLIAYDVNSPLWSDGANKLRWLGLPNSGPPFTPAEQIGFAPTGEWTFPNGTVFVKHFELATDETNPSLRRRIETRVLVRDANGAVYGATYKWRSDDSDADLVTNSLNEDIVITNISGVRTQTWYYPSPADCLFCHRPVANYVLGVKTRQLNGDHLYAESGVTDNQLRTLNQLGMFYPPITNETMIGSFARLTSVTNTSAPLEERVRSYLDSNCAQCHRPGGPGPSFDARYDTPLTNQTIINGNVINPLGVDNMKVVTPRDVWRSAAYQRINTLAGSTKMPPIARNVVDTNAVSAMEQWINSLSGTAALPPPTITPAGGSFNGQAMVTLTDSDAGAQIVYSIDGSLPDTNSTAYAGPFAINASTTLRAVAVKSGFNNSVASAATFIINQLPLVAITNPANASMFIAPATVTLDAQVSDPDGSVASVIFYSSTNLLGQIGTAPYTLTLSNLAAGIYTFTAVAFDNLGASTTSGVVTVTADQLPSVTLTNPVDASLFVAPASITLAADANDTDGSIGSVTFYNDTNQLAQVSAPPFVLALTNLSAGTYAFTASAVDDLGLSTTSAVVHVTVDQLPTVTLTNPPDASLFVAPAAITLGADANDADGAITSVTFHNGTNTLGQATTPPYVLTLTNLNAGNYAFTASAVDDLGLSTTSAVIHVTVDQPPSVTLSNPLASTVFAAPATIPLAADAIDTDGSVASVRFFAGTNQLAEVAAPPYTFVWTNVVAGTYQLTAQAADNLSVTSTSSVVTVVVDQPPSVTLTNPASGMVFISPTNIALGAAAADLDGTVASVEFFADTNRLGAATSAPFVICWTNAPAGIHSLTARATDDLGITAASAPVSITVLPPNVTAHYSDGQLVISWPDTGLEYILQMTTDLTPPVQWAPAPETPVHLDGQVNVTISTTNEQRFYRLGY